VDLKLRCGTISIDQDVCCVIGVELKVRCNVGQVLDQLVLAATDAGVSRRTRIERPFENKIVRERSQNFLEIPILIVTIELGNRLPNIHGASSLDRWGNVEYAWGSRAC